MLRYIYSLFLFSLFSISSVEGVFPIFDRADYHIFSENREGVLVASAGSAGTKLLVKALQTDCIRNTVFGTHLLPPSKSFLGKVVYIYCNPDKAAESFLHRTITSGSWGRGHFEHVETADIEFLDRIGETTHQTEVDNLLTHDAFGVGKHFEVGSNRMPFRVALKRQMF